jgi:hypothetical protein
MEKNVNDKLISIAITISLFSLILSTSSLVYSMQHITAQKYSISVNYNDAIFSYNVSEDVMMLSGQLHKNESIIDEIICAKYADIEFDVLCISTHCIDNKNVSIKTHDEGFYLVDSNNTLTKTICTSIDEIRVNNFVVRVCISHKEITSNSFVINIIM